MRVRLDALSRIINLITFSDMPLQRKFLLFSSGVGIWFVLLALIGVAATDNPVFRKVILYLALIAIALLAMFALFLSRSLIKPINTMKEEIDSLSAGGEINLKKKIAMTSRDEIGELSQSFNRLLDTLEAMDTFKKVIEEDDTPDDIYKRLANSFNSLGLERFQIYEVSNSKNTIRPVHSSFNGGDGFCSRDILVNCNLCRAKKTGEIVSSVEYPGICKHFLNSVNQNHICVPMIIGDSTGGIVEFMFEKNAVTADMQRKVTMARKYIKEALPVLEAKRLMDTLKESSLRDSMTGLYNRRFLEEYSETLVASTHRRGTTLGLLMCDIDFFKEINDTYGHNIGDTVLKEASNIIKDSVRSSDMVIRFGGEEFLAVLQDLKDGESASIGEKIRKKMEDTKIKMPRGFIHKTISVGISEFPKDTANFWQAIKFSDIALYKAKDSGRNQVVRFTRDMWSTEEY
jgi:diguanylate cyclase (GGDEF)-like protein